MRARLFYVPLAASFEAERLAARADWAEVESCDSPGAGAARGAEPDGVRGVVEAARRRLDDLGWDRCALVADSHGQAAAVELALGQPERFTAVCLSHAAARYRLSGDRPAMTPAIHSAAEQLLETDYRSFARAITQVTLGLATDEWMERWIDEVPVNVARSILGDLKDHEPELASRLRGFEGPVVLGQHKGCVMWTPESFADACKALPDAEPVVCEGIPTDDPVFVEAVRATVSRVASA